MTTDVIAPVENVTPTLNYLLPGAYKPTRYVADPPPGVPALNGIDDPRPVAIEDAGGREAEFTLDRNGFALRHAPTEVRDFSDAEEVRGVYYPEVDRLLREATGAFRTRIFDHTLRKAGNERSGGGRGPVYRVHNDQTPRSAQRRVSDHLGAEAAELLQYRFGIVNVWPPIRGPVLDSPLALCDARSATDADLVASDLVYPHVRGETSSVVFNPSHRWFYFSRMQPDEVILIRVHDSAEDGRACLSFHSALLNPVGAQDAPPRESIEVRTLVFYPKGQDRWI